MKVLIFSLIIFLFFLNSYAVADDCDSTKVFRIISRMTGEILSVDQSGFDYLHSADDLGSVLQGCDFWYFCSVNGSLLIQSVSPLAGNLVLFDSSQLAFLINDVVPGYAIIGFQNTSNQTLSYQNYVNELFTPVPFDPSNLYTHWIVSPADLSEVPTNFNLNVTPANIVCSEQVQGFRLITRMTGKALVVSSVTNNLILNYLDSSAISVETPIPGSDKWTECWDNEENITFLKNLATGNYFNYDEVENRFYISDQINTFSGVRQDNGFLGYYYWGLLKSSKVFNLSVVYNDDVLALQNYDASNLYSQWNKQIVDL